jgi:hypothetical protein
LYRGERGAMPLSSLDELVKVALSAFPDLMRGSFPAHSKSSRSVSE